MELAARQGLGSLAAAARSEISAKLGSESPAFLPLIQQGAKLTGSDETGTTCSFGSAVALSADGNTALIIGGDNNGGGAWVFTRSGSTWTQQGPKLTGSGPASAPTWRCRRTGTPP